MIIFANFAALLAQLYTKIVKSIPRNHSNEKNNSLPQAGQDQEIIIILAENSSKPVLSQKERCYTCYSDEGRCLCLIILGIIFVIAFIITLIGLHLSPNQPTSIDTKKFVINELKYNIVFSLFFIFNYNSLTNNFSNIFSIRLQFYFSASIPNVYFRFTTLLQRFQHLISKYVDLYNF